MAADCLSASGRVPAIGRACEKVFDVLVTGGGITGGGIALDAASRGLSVLLLEKLDFASGTSSRSTKLIHGGLRYLKNLEFRLVHEVGKERAVLCKNAPYLVYPEKMLLPVYRGGQYSRFFTSLGLRVYDLLAGVKKNERRKMLTLKEAYKKESMLSIDGLTGAGLYYEYRTDDARLVMELVKTACTAGAQCFNYIKVQEFIYRDKKICGVKAIDKETGKEYLFHAKHIVNATGPWADELLKQDDTGRKGMLHHTKGVHIVLPHARLPVSQSVYFGTRDSRMIFAIPRNGTTYIGTTDTDYRGPLEDPVVSGKDADYLLEAVNKKFHGTRLTRADILSAWAGIRPLIHQEGKSLSDISRKDEVVESSSGLITITGGKLTGYRAMAEKITDLVMKRLAAAGEKKFIACKTKNIPFAGNGFAKHGGFKNYKESLAEKILPYGYTRDDAVMLARRYGNNADIIAERFLSAPQGNAFGLLEAEVWYAVNFEAARNITDFMARRTDNLFFRTDKIPVRLPVVASAFAALLGWDEEQKKQQADAFAGELRNATTFA